MAAEAPPEFGEIAVVVSEEPVAIEMEHVTAGWAAGMGTGFVRGGEAFAMWPFGLGTAPEHRVEWEHDLVGEVLSLLALPGIVIQIVVTYPLFKAGAVVYLPVSVVGGAVTAVSPDDAEAAERSLEAIARDGNNAARLVAAFDDGARRRGRVPVAPEAADTVLEIRLVSIGRGRWSNWWTLDRAFGIEVEGRVRAIRRSDGVVVWEATRKAGDEGSVWCQFPAVDPTIPTHRYLEWAADGGASFRRALDFRLTALGDDLAALALPVQPTNPGGQPAR